jgi:fatty-acyl-CoA synthase
MSNPGKPQRTPAEIAAMARSHIGRTAFVLGLVAAIALAFAPFGVREAMFDLDYAVAVVAKTWAWNLALPAAGLGLAALVMALALRPRRGFILPLLAIALGVGVIVAVVKLQRLVDAHPPIHDVATDWSDPLIFGAGMTASRGLGANPVQRAPRVGIQPFDTMIEGDLVSEVNAKTCPGATPLTMAGTTDAAFDKAKAAIEAEGLTVVTENRLGGRIEATGEHPQLRLKHDVLARVRTEGEGARVDFRSISRAGEIDLGENCARVTRLRAATAG